MRRYAIGVCGFPRCGSSMMMRMLEAGGVPPVAGSSTVGYEVAGLDAMRRLPPAGQAIKLLDLIDREPLAAGDWQFVWLDRMVVEQAKSNVKFLRGIAGLDVPPDYPEKLYRSFTRERPILLGLLRATGPTLVLSYEETLARPLRTAKRLANFFGQPFDVRAAAHVVHVRPAACAPGLDYELQA